MRLRDLAIRAEAHDGSASLRKGSGPSLATTSPTWPSLNTSHTVGPRRSVRQPAPIIRIRTCPTGSGERRTRGAPPFGEGAVQTEMHAHDPAVGVVVEQVLAQTLVRRKHLAVDHAAHPANRPRLDPATVPGANRRWCNRASRAGVCPSGPLPRLRPERGHRRRLVGAFVLGENVDRRWWRWAFDHGVVRKASTMANASATVCMRPLIPINCALFCSRARDAVLTLHPNAHRAPGTLLAAICSPLPGNGEQIAANKCPGHGARWRERETATLAREHNNAQLIGSVVVCTPSPRR